MIKIRVDTNKGSKVIESITGWDECTVKQYQDLWAKWEPEKPNLWERNWVNAFNILNGTDFPMENDPTIDSVFYKAIKFIYNDDRPFENYPLPIKFKVAGKEVTIPKDIQALTIGQNLMVRQRMSQSDNVLESMAYAVAVYLQPLVYPGKVNEDKINELEQEILRMKISEVYPIGFFLLTKRIDYGASMPIEWNPGKISRIKKPVIWLRSWLGWIGSMGSRT
jgi:hypothetical protein